MNNYGPRMLINIFIGAGLSAGWLWLTTQFSNAPRLSGGTLFWGTIVWSTALIYVLSYRFPVLRRKLRLPIVLPICFGAACFGYYHVCTQVGRDQAWWLSWAVFIPAILLAGPLTISSLRNRIWRSPWWRRIVRFGDGDTAQWANRLDYNRLEIQLPRKHNGKLGWLDRFYLGMSTFRFDVSPRHIGLKSSVHLLSYGMSGSGKSATLAWSNYVLLRCGALIVDLKGEHFKKTHKRRAEIGDVYNCDPLNITGQPSCQINPLHGIDVTTEEGLRLISEVRNAFVLSEENTTHGSHFADNGGTIIEGVMTWVCFTFPEEQRNLVTVYRILSSRDLKTGAYDPELFVNAVAEMSQCPIGLCAEAAKLVDDASVDEGGAYLTTINKSIKWLSSKGMQHHLSGTSCPLKALAKSGEKNMPTIYLCLGMGNEKDYQRYIRMMTAVGIFQIRAEYRRTGKRPDPGILISLDEFSLFCKGLDCVNTGFATLREVGCMLWVLAQKRSQLTAVLGEEGTSLLEQNSTVTVMGCNNDNDDMAAWVSNQLGSHTITKKTGEEGLLSGKPTTATVPLMTRRAVQDVLTQLSPDMHVFPAHGGPPMWLDRMGYKDFKIEGKRHFKPLDLGDIFDDTDNAVKEPSDEE